MQTEKNILVPEDLSEVRADVGLAKILGISRSQISDLINAGRVSNFKGNLKKSDNLNANDLITVNFFPPKEPLKIEPNLIPGLKVIYTDADILVIDKPAGIASHASLGWEGDNVLNGVAGMGYTVATSGPPERQGIVQRLDVGTSGLMVLARSEKAYSVLKEMFRNREVSKTYHALVQGFPDPMSGTIDAPIAPHKGGEWKFMVARGGKPSITHYETLEAFRYATLMKIKLETGRTHQIRVHFSELKHPLIGDLVYGADPKIAKKLGLERQWLHASELAFSHPLTKEILTFHSAYPEDLQNALKILNDMSYNSEI